MSGSLRLAVLMPPVTNLPPDEALDRWTTVTATVRALAQRDDVVPVVHARHADRAAVLERDGVTHRFHPSDAALVAAVRADRPDSVHVHGLGWTRLLRRLRAVDAPVALQHHGEPVFAGRARWGHRLVRSGVAAYLFTGADHGQAQPWIDTGVIAADAQVIDVLEAASLLPDDDGPAVQLEGAPAVLWVGRLVDGKDPLTAVRAFALLAERQPGAHLHLLATDRTLEPELRAAIAALGPVGAQVHVHDPVPHDAMGAWYSAADVYLSTSHHEGSGYSLIEAMSRGCAPAVTSIPPHRSIAGDVGAMFAVGDASAAASAMERAAVTARATVAERSRSVLSWTCVADRLVDVHRSLG
jgi:glycosyltransferase involved in cell wall biosynthesis